MPSRDRDYTYLTLTQGMCRECRQLVNAKIIFRDGKVFQQNLCPAHGKSSALIAEDAGWYMEMIRAPGTLRRPRIVSKPVAAGCPRDCGLCSFHVQACNLPVISITNACNLDCPICFTFNRKDRRYFMSAGELAEIIDWIAASSGPVDLINLTGGEPTLHPQLLALLDECRRPEIGRITMNSNGLKLAEDSRLARELAQRGIYAVLSFNTFDDRTSALIHGRYVLAQKIAALDALQKNAVPTTLLNVMIRDVNDGEIGRIIELAVQEDFIRSVTIQTMTYTGYGGRRFSPSRHLPVDAVMQRIEEQTAGKIKKSDFFPMPSVHPLCYAVTYLLTDRAGSYVPLARHIPAEALQKAMQDGYLLHPGEEFAVAIDQAITDAWAQAGGNPENERFLKMARMVMDEVYPSGISLTPHQRQARAEKFIKTIYIHTHMDEDNFDIDRARRCGDLVPDRPGSFIPACTYNLFYRQKDRRFWSEDES